MKWWKKWWSYILPIHIESVGSKFNDSLDLYLINNRLRLTTLDAIYSFDDRYYNFYKVFKDNSLPSNGSHVLVLGLGLGSIPYMLEHSFHRDYHYTGVELDDAVLYLYGKYQQQRIQSPLEIIETDAASYIKIQNKTFDLICIDIFIGETIPSHIKSDEFIRNIEHAIHPDGRILWNMLYATDEQIREVDEFIENQFKYYFPDFQVMEILGNVILTNRQW